MITEDLNAYQNSHYILFTESQIENYYFCPFSGVRILEYKMQDIIKQDQRIIPYNWSHISQWKCSKEIPGCKNYRESRSTFRLSLCSRNISLGNNRTTNWENWKKNKQEFWMTYLINSGIKNEWTLSVKQHQKAGIETALKNKSKETEFENNLQEL